MLFTRAAFDWLKFQINSTVLLLSRFVSLPTLKPSEADAPVVY